MRFFIYFCADMDITSIIRPLFMRRVAESNRHSAQPEATQRRVLDYLVRRARGTRWGLSHNYSRLKSYEDFRSAVDITPYPEIRAMVMEMVAGGRDILWPGVTRRFAQSSGTSDGKSKYIPVTADSLRLSHYRGGSDVVAHYLNLYPDSRMFSGKSFILGGSFANELELPAGCRAKVGDLSANLIEAINPLANMVRIPSKRIALMADWHAKLPALVEASCRADVTNISGVPSWFLTVLQELLKECGASHIHEIWPNLEVFFHGGISMTPYRDIYNSIIDPGRMRYLETYNASEGFFAVQDRRDSRAMLLLLDAGTFYEFQPMDKPEAQPVAAWQVEPGKIYSLIISSCNGLWRYPIGDTVKIESVLPLRITIAGRTKHYINAFGEEVMVHNTDAALAEACRECGCSVSNYTVAPVFTTSRNQGHHQWLIEFITPPEDMERFASQLDLMLTRQNSDYQAKRAGNIFLMPLTITTVPRGLFDRWLESTGKLGGQRKVPRLSNDRTIIDSMLKQTQ